MAAVEKFFQTSTDPELLGCYAWCQAVASGLLPILGDFEVALRNKLHVSLSQHYGGVDSFNWMMTNPNPASATNPKASPLPAVHKMNPRTQSDIQAIVQKKTNRRTQRVTPDDVVAALAFGFWEQIINSLDNPAHPTGLQAAILSGVFPHAPDLNVCSYSSPAFKQRVVDLLSKIRDVRNRIGHHDSIWAIPEFDTQGKVGFIPRRPRHTVNSLIQLADRIAWFAGWMDPAITQHIKNSDHWWSFHALLNQKALDTYRVTGGGIGTYGKILRQQPNDQPCIYQINNCLKKLFSSHPKHQQLYY
jgi:hypothetical protein